jgi:hypothetical protein
VTFGDITSRAAFIIPSPHFSRATPPFDIWKYPDAAKEMDLSNGKTKCTATKKSRHALSCLRPITHKNVHVHRQQ